jgi:hypothetical protein
MLDIGGQTMYKDVHDYCKSYYACQRIGGWATQSLAKLVTSLPNSKGIIYEMGI